MFHVSQWTQDAVDSTPSLQHIQLWAHLNDVPFDLIHSEGLSHIAGQIGEPKETDEWTLSLTSISIAHVKVEVNTSMPLPKIVEVGRSNGSFVEVEVEYPWIPPICSHCKELEHISRNCLLLPEPPKTVPSSKTPANNPTAKPTSNPTSSKIYCYSCNAQGHLMKNCPKGPQEWIEVSGRKKQTSDPMDSQSSEAHTSPAAEDSVPPGNASASHSAAEFGGDLIPLLTQLPPPPPLLLLWKLTPPKPSPSLPTPLPDTTLPLPPLLPHLALPKLTLLLHVYEILSSPSLLFSMLDLSLLSLISTLQLILKPIPKILPHSTLFPLNLCQTLIPPSLHLPLLPLPLLPLLHP